jgi:hypothetical protein
MTKILIDAINARVADYTRGLDAALDSIENDPEAYDKVHTLREAIELVRCLRRIIQDLPINAIYKAFGAPGDFGYDTPIGDALSRLYRSSGGSSPYR